MKCDTVHYTLINALIMEYLLPYHLVIHCKSMVLSNYSKLFSKYTQTTVVDTLTDLIYVSGVTFSNICVFWPTQKKGGGGGWWKMLLNERKGQENVS